jgi:predicted nuclease of predicted toxin-antitoxin system
MKFLIDVNASGALARWLQSMGHDVSSVADQDPRMSDDAILEWATHEKRIIVTTDRDFEEMVWREGRAHAGLLRLENLPRAERKALSEEVITRYSQHLESGSIIIATAKKVRIRRPSK